MKIKWYGHAAFALTTSQGVKIIIDPYEPGAFGGALAYGKITDEADIVLSSHVHDDHNYIKDIKGPFVLINRQGRYEEKGITIRAVPTFHDPSGGNERGENLIFIVNADDMTVVHAGDLGHTLDAEGIKNVGRVDVLFLPVGGLYTIDATEATKVTEDLNPLVTIPMHFKTEKCSFPIAVVEEFTKGKERVRLLGEAEVEITRETLPARGEIMVLRHGL